MSITLPCPFRRSAYTMRKSAVDVAKQLKRKLQEEFIVVPCESCKGFHVQRKSL